MGSGTSRRSNNQRGANASSSSNQVIMSQTSQPQPSVVQSGVELLPVIQEIGVAVESFHGNTSIVADHVPPELTLDTTHNFYEYSVPSLMLLTPGREENLNCSVAKTPVGKDVHEFRYYCPLCMEFFKDILKSKCCGNYSCIRCIKDYLQGKGMLVPTSNHLFDSVHMEKICCPHCFTVGLNLRPVELQDAPRDYYTSSTSSACSSSLPCSSSGLEPVSPVRVGDSFEALKRKMIPFSSKMVIDNPSCERVGDNREGERDGDGDGPANLQSMAVAALLMDADESSEGLVNGCLVCVDDGLMSSSVREGGEEEGQGESVITGAGDTRSGESDGLESLTCVDSHVRLTTPIITPRITELSTLNSVSADSFVDAGLPLDTEDNCSRNLFAANTIE